MPRPITDGGIAWFCSCLLLCGRSRGLQESLILRCPAGASEDEAGVTELEISLSKRIDDDGEGREVLPPAGVIEVIAGEFGGPVFEE